MYLPLAAIEAFLILMILSYALRAIFRISRKSFDVPQRMADILMACVGLLWTLPVLIVIAILIKISSLGRTVFVRSTPCGIRYGLGGKPFHVWKFRTMNTCETPRPFAYKFLAEDDRLTPIGRLLKKTGLDDLPLLVNVLLGDMSVFGPKPLLLEEAKELANKYPERFAVKPGMVSAWDVERYLVKLRQACVRRIVDQEMWLISEKNYVPRMSLIVSWKISLRYFPKLLARFFLRLEEVKVTQPVQAATVAAQLPASVSLFVLTNLPVVLLVLSLLT